MKTLLIKLVLAVALGATALGQDATSSTFDYIRNPYIPYDCVELSPDQNWSLGDFWAEKPEQRPKDVPATYVLIKVYQQVGEQWMFCGYYYMEPEDVNSLHIDPDNETL